MRSNGLEVDKEIVGIPSATRPRLGWNEKFRLMSESGDDKMIDDDLLGQTEWDRGKWEW